ncbi:hypothetical protein NA57DRAFT_61499 [Rhizodiscina lignyota]|uniref:Uncharacterized protein n=1 Tax=Rhizodiscina lignyota TaxID=1504668 RepID=A0A9P4M1C0_9PEZI|nr:hypothetical protein NA57DRAFT_61499 [Rhizodiscina lignyota]
MPTLRDIASHVWPLKPAHPHRSSSNPTAGDISPTITANSALTNESLPTSNYHYGMNVAVVPGGHVGRDRRSSPSAPNPIKLVLFPSPTVITSRTPVTSPLPSPADWPPTSPGRSFGMVIYEARERKSHVFPYPPSAPKPDKQPAAPAREFFFQMMHLHTSVQRMDKSSDIDGKWSLRFRLEAVFGLPWSAVFNGCDRANH